MVLCVHFQVKELKTWSETFEVKEEGVLFTALYGAVVCCGLGCALFGGGIYIFAGISLSPISPETLINFRFG